MNRNLLGLLIILSVLVPPLFLIVVLIFALKPIRNRQFPNGAASIDWIIALMTIGGISMFPIGSVYSEALKSVPRSVAVAILSVLGLGIVNFMIFRLRSIPETKEEAALNFPLKSFRIDYVFILGLLLSLLPFANLLIKSEIEHQINVPLHPILQAVHVWAKQDFYSAAFIGFLSLAILTPIFEECLFRGILMYPGKFKSKWTRRALNLGSVGAFAAVHLPVSFFLPLVLGLFLLKLRNRTGSLIPSIICHGLWNASVLTVVLLKSKGVA